VGVVETEFIVEFKWVLGVKAAVVGVKVVGVGVKVEVVMRVALVVGTEFVDDDDPV
jgi:hypothetical protein